MIASTGTPRILHGTRIFHDLFPAEDTTAHPGVTTCRHRLEGGTRAATARSAASDPAPSVPGGQDAELVALGVGHDDPGGRARILPDVDASGAEGLEAADFGLLVPVRRRGQIDVQPVLHRFALRQGLMF
jgi:hypothetical protein